MAYLTRSGIIGATVRERVYGVETIPHPEHRGQTCDVRMRYLLGDEVERLRQSMFDKDGKEIRKRSRAFAYLLFALAFVDDDGKRVLSDDDVTDTAFPQKRNAFIEAVKTLGRKYAELDDVEDVESEVKNLQATGEPSSSSDSPSEQECGPPISLTL